MNQAEKSQRSRELILDAALKLAPGYDEARIAKWRIYTAQGEHAKAVAAVQSVAPGIGFGEYGDAYVRFALIENEQRIGQGVRNLRRALTKL